MRYEIVWNHYFKVLIAGVVLTCIDGADSISKGNRAIGERKSRITKKFDVTGAEK